MPAKRKIDDFDPNKSDSDDSTYGASSTRPARSRPSKSQLNKPSRKRQRRDYDGSDDLSDEEDDLSEDSFHEEPRVEEEATEYDEATGRPKRKTRENRKTYQEPDSEDDIEDSAPEPVATPAKKPKTKPSKIVKLKLTLPSNRNPTRRNTRARSSSVTARPTSAGNVFGTRRSSRIAHDDSEPIVALTDSGHHANVVRAGTRSPPSGGPSRSRVGGKGPKKGPATSIVYEEEHSSGQTKDEVMEDDALHQIEVAASREDLGDDEEEDPQSQAFQRLGTHHALQHNLSALGTVGIDDGAVIPESEDESAQVQHDEDDEDPISQPRRITRRSEKIVVEASPVEDEGRGGSRPSRRTLRPTAEKRTTRSAQRSGRQESSDFEPAAEEGEEDNVSDSEASKSSPRKADDSSASSRRNTRAAKGQPRTRRKEALEDEGGGVADELAEEVEDLRASRSRHARRSEIIYEDKPQTRKRKPVDYRILRPDMALPIEEDDQGDTATPSKRARGGGGGWWARSLHSTYGPFGGAGGPPPVFGGPGGLAAAGGADSDSSDDEVHQRSRAGYGGTVGLTPTTGPQGFGLFQPAQTHNADPHQAPSGTPANVGKVKDKQALADVDPLGVDVNVNFDGVGGLQGHIDQLKEMVSLPLLYPEIFQRFHVTPPRGVLFHGPPGTGKTLLARALASSVSSQGRKVTFYMRKGADALSKWVGEAERQLRLLFDEARKTQPSIIFFDEIDGLAPVRSSKQEQIHSSIVSTLLALMDGMDGRGQVIVIGATNRPDSVDPALRRPGRFDREFYFPLPNLEARRMILDIHTKGWDPPLAAGFKDEVAALTKGYGGADLRALCTEAALNAVQRRYPQIYRSNEKLQIDPASISVSVKDFLISVKNLIPSSERSTTSGASPLPSHVEPLLRHPLAEIENVVGEILPRKQFERSRIFRPRLLIRGLPGMGQQYLAAALLNHLEGLHIQSLDLSTLLGDSTKSAEAAVIQLFAEARRHKPSVIFIPNVEIWFTTVGDSVISTFNSLLRSLAPTDPVMLLGVMEGEADQINEARISSLFGYSKRNQFEVQRPPRPYRHDYFQGLAQHLSTSPADFPEPANRKKRRLEVLPPVPPEPEKPLAVLSKQELKAQKKRDRHSLNLLKLRIQPIIDQIRNKLKKFRTGVVEESKIRYLFEEEDPTLVSTDLPREQRGRDHFRPYELGHDEHGEPGLVETATGKFLYNLEIVTIEKRLSNGYYKRPKDFLSDIKKLAKDARAIGDEDRLLKANELLANVEVDLSNIETMDPSLVAELEQVYVRELKREKELMEKQRLLRDTEEERRLQLLPPNTSPGDAGDAALAITEQSTGPVMLGEPMTNGYTHHPRTPPSQPTRPSQPSQPSLSSSLSNKSSIPLSDLSDLQPRYSQSNGTSVPSRDNGYNSSSQDDPSSSTDPPTQDNSFGQSAQTRPFSSYTGAPNSLQHRRSIPPGHPGELSQNSAMTPMAQGSVADDYHNDASTTSSDKRNTGSSGEKNTASQSLEFQTQSEPAPSQSQENGILEGPDFSVLPEVTMSSSQFPDTQPQAPASQSSGNSSAPSSQGQGQFQSLASKSASNRLNPSISALLNADPDGTRGELQRLIIDRHEIDHFLNVVIDESSGFSVEQLEQMYSVLMDKIWKTRGDWNRTRVTSQVLAEFHEASKDIGDCQRILPPSQEEFDRYRG
ncbi:MAG: hypothetical protein Q9174_000406, partial [Haloplaca sp. 1 TL-2023]